MNCIICTLQCSTTICKRCNVVCHDECIKEWCSFNPGEIIIKSKLCCPKCRDPLSNKYVKIDVDRIIEDEKHHYIYCVSCEKPKQYCEKSCSIEINNEFNMICSSCDTVLHRECPTCGVMINKISGCNHVECICGSHICWLCGLKFKYSEIYLHIQNHKSTYQQYYDAVNYSMCLSQVPTKYWTESLILRAITRNNSNFLFIQDRPNNFIMKVIDRAPDVLAFITKQTDEICMKAVKIDGLTLKFVKNRTREICLAAIKQNAYSIIYVDNLTDEICYAAVSKKGKLLKYIENQSRYIRDTAIKQSMNSFYYAEEQDEETCFELIRKNPFIIKVIRQENLTDEMCREAVMRNPQTISHIPRKTPELYLIAIKKDSSYLAATQNQTNEMCYEAIKQNPLMLGFVKSGMQSYDICMFAVKQDFNAIHEIHDKKLRLHIFFNYIRFKLFD